MKSAPMHRSLPPVALLGEVPVGLLYVAALPLLAGIATMRGTSLEIGGFNYTGFLWAGALFLGLILLLADKSRNVFKRGYFPVLLWLPWVGFVLASLSWVESRTMLEVQYAVQLAMPVVVGAIAAQFVRTSKDLEMLMRAFRGTLPLLIAFSILWNLADLDDSKRTDLFIQIRAIALTLILIAAVYLSGSRQKPLRSWLGWGLCLAATVLTGSRTASMAILLLPVANPISRNVFRKFAAVIAVLVVAGGLLAIPQVRERFLGGSGEEVPAQQKGQINSSGRFDVWPLVYEEAMRRFWLGHGVGTVQHFTLEIWEDVPHPHNDYLRVGYELGAVGLAIFVVSLIVQQVMLIRLSRRTGGVARQALAAASMSWTMFLVVALTDNPITYTLPWMCPLFALIGGATTVAHLESDSSNLPRVYARKAAFGAPTTTVSQPRF